MCEKGSASSLSPKPPRNWPKQGPRELLPAMAVLLSPHSRNDGLSNGHIDGGSLWGTTSMDKHGYPSGFMVFATWNIEISGTCYQIWDTGNKQRFGYPECLVGGLPPDRGGQDIFSEGFSGGMSKWGLRVDRIGRGAEISDGRKDDIFGIRVVAGRFLGE